MEYRRLGKTGLMVSEIGLGGEWLERHNTEEVFEVIDAADKEGINIVDCWMSNPEVRANIGKALRGRRDRWIIQGQIGSAWENGQYIRTREIGKVKKAFEDLLDLMETDYMDIGMIHFVDEIEEWKSIQQGPFHDYLMELKEKGVIRHIGLSTHNPEIGVMAAESGYVEMILFSVNPAYDMLPASEDYNIMFADRYEDSLKGIDPARSRFYDTCVKNDVGITVMKGFAGGRLFDKDRSPFGVALTPLQCVHYALTRPAVASILPGMETVEQVKDIVRYETASEEEKDYASVLKNAPMHAVRGLCTYCGHCQPCPAGIDIALVNKYYDLAMMQPEVPATLKAHYEALPAKADACLGCLSCEERCPFGVKIGERMKKAAELLG